MSFLLIDNLLLQKTLLASKVDLHPHLGLLSLAAIVKDAGFEVSIFDPKVEISTGRIAYDSTVYKRAAETILSSFSPTVVGFTSLGCSFLFAVRVAALLKKQRPELPVLLGGPHATILHREILDRFSQFDAVVRHEAEQTIASILNRISNERDFSGIPGVTWRKGKTVIANEGIPRVENLDELPKDVFNLTNIENLGLEALRVEAGRGCPFSCTFCSTASFFGRSYRLKSPERIVRELCQLRDRYGISHFILNHDLFTVDKRKVTEVCEALRGKDLTWGCSARVDCVDDELLEKMQTAGCRRIYFGIETGSSRMQEVVKKRLDLDLVSPILDKAAALGILSMASFITGYPEETQDDQNATLDLIGDCFRRSPKHVNVQLHLLTPEPGTALYLQHRDQLQFDGYVTDFNAICFDNTDRDLIHSNPEIFNTYFYYSAVLPRSRHTLAVDVVRLLRIVGHTISSYTLSHFDGKLSVFLNRVFEWAAPSNEMVFDSDRLIGFFYETFGPEHHLTSLFRFALGHLNSSKEANNKTPHWSFRLTRSAYLLENIHDCVRILSGIELRPQRSGVLNERDTGMLANYLILDSQGVRTTYQLTDRAFQWIQSESNADETRNDRLVKSLIQSANSSEGNGLIPATK